MPEKKTSKYSMEQEIIDTYKLLKQGGFNVVEIVFEGGISVKDKSVLKQLQVLVDSEKAFGVAKIVYLSKDGSPRMIEIPSRELTQEDLAPPSG
jgi:hypothetical protein